MKVILSANQLFCRWMRLDLPRMPSPPGKQVGVERLVTNEDQISIQLHAVRPNAYHLNATVIAVEAYSRYAIIIPDCPPMPLADFEDLLLSRWVNEMSYLMQDSGALPESLIPMVHDQVDEMEFDLSWFKNTDLRVNGHVSDACQWYKSALSEYGVDALSLDEAFDLGLHINKMLKNVKRGQRVIDKIIPITRFVDDGLFRFAKGLADFQFEDTVRGDFPNPYSGEDFPPALESVVTPKAKAAAKPADTKTASSKMSPNHRNNVISMAEYLKQKRS